jgi:hypothetical protein
MLTELMTKWNRPKWVVSAAVTAAVYFSTALYLKHSYAKPPKPPGAVFRLNRPFFENPGSKFVVAVPVPSLENLSDSMEFPARSPFTLYENATPMGPAHTIHVEIGEYGHGRFSHWNSDFIFSSSDGTNPKTNGRTYWVVQPR